MVEIVNDELVDAYADRAGCNESIEDELLVVEEPVRGRNSLMREGASGERMMPLGNLTSQLLANIYMVAASRCFGQHGLIGSTPKLRWFRTPMIPGTGLAVRLNQMQPQMGRNRRLGTLIGIICSHRTH